MHVPYFMNPETQFLSHGGISIAGFLDVTKYRIYTVHKVSLWLAGNTCAVIFML